MNNFKKEKDDLLKDWIEYRTETIPFDEEDKKHCIHYDEITERILKNIPIQNKKYVMKQLDLLDKNYMDYLDYWCDKYYRNGFIDGLQIFIKI